MLVNKKWIVGAGCTAIVAIGSIAGVLAANSNNRNNMVAVLSTSNSKIVTSALTTSETEASTTTEAITMEETNPKAPTTQKQTEARKTDTSTTLEPKVIALNSETKRGEGTLTFTTVTIRYDRNAAIFSYTTSDKNAIMPIESGTYCIGKSGTKYKAEGMGGKGDTGEIWFVGITDPTDLSTVTLIYAFEDMDPVTVTINIPGV